MRSHSIMIFSENSELTTRIHIINMREACDVRVEKKFKDLNDFSEYLQTSNNYIKNGDVSFRSSLFQYARSTFISLNSYTTEVLISYMHQFISVAKPARHLVMEMQIFLCF